MEEDVLGPREEAIGDRYSRCARCGHVVPHSELRLVSTEGTGLAVEQVELCVECQEMLASGEADWPLEEYETSG